MTRKITGRHRRNKLDLNSEGDRDYLSSRGFVYALIAVGARRGRVISAHYHRKTAEAYVRDFASNSPLEMSKSPNSPETNEGAGVGADALFLRVEKAKEPIRVSPR